LELDLVLGQVNPRNGVFMQLQVVLLLKDVAQRMTNIFGRNQISSDLVKHRLESVIIMLVNQCDLDIGLGCKIEVPAIGLRFTGESVLQILFGLRALELHECLLTETVGEEAKRNRIRGGRSDSTPRQRPRTNSSCQWN
jgi:hypothetical protein